MPANPVPGGSLRPVLKPRREPRAMLELVARDSLRIQRRLGRRLLFQLRQLEIADAGNAVTIDGDEPKGRVRIGDGTEGSAGLPTREWSWMYREHNAGVARLLAEQRLRLQRPGLRVSGEEMDPADDAQLLHEALELLSPAELEAELRKRGVDPKTGEP